MAKGVSRVNGRGGESMWVDGEQLSFRTGGKVVHMGLDGVRSIDLANAEDARKLVEATELVPHGAWTDEMPPTKGKSDFVAVMGDNDCWVMEISKNQSPNALTFVRGIMPVERPQAEDYKLYAAIQTPLGAVLTVGSIACVCGATFAVYSLEMPLLGIALGVAAIVMWLKVK